MADFVKSSCKIKLPRPEGGSGYSQSLPADYRGAYYHNLVITIKTAAGAKELKLKSYYDKSDTETYLILSDNADTDASAATEDSSLMSKELAEDEYRVGMFFHNIQKNIEDSLGYPKDLFNPNSYFMWAFMNPRFQSNGRYLEVVFDAAKIPDITALSIDNSGCGTSTPYSMEYAGNVIQTERQSNGSYYGKLSLAVPKKLSMLVKRDDGTLWTLGSANADPTAVVTIADNQTITSEKVFTVVPKVTAEPTAKDDVATVGLINDMIFGKGPFKTDLSLICEPTNASSWVVVSNAEVILDNGKKLKCIHLENTAPTVATAPVKCVFKLIDESEAITEQPQRQEASFFDTYSLQDGELLGSVTYGHLLNSEWQEYSTYYAPFHNAQYGCQGATKECPLMHISIEEVPAAVNKLKLNLTSYLPKTMKATVVCGGMSAESNLIDNPTAQTYELEFNTTGGGGLVTLDSEQTITGKKHFDVMPQSSATPSDPEDLVTLGFLDTKIDSSVAVTDVLVSIKASDNYYQCIKEIKFKTAGGQFLVPVYLENVQVKDATAPIRFVFKLSDTYTSTVQWKESDFFKDYQLKDGEFFGSYVAAHILDARWMEYENENNEPFRQYIAWTTTEPRGLWPLMRYEFQNLPSELKQVEYTVGYTSSYPDCFSEISFLVNSGLKSFESEVYKDGLTLNSEHLVEFVYKKLNPVIVETEQTITGKKTFTVLPKSSVDPVSPFDMVPKKYVDKFLFTPRDYTLSLRAKQRTDEIYMAISKVKFCLQNGAALRPVYIENTSPQQTESNRIIYEVSYEEHKGPYAPPQPIATDALEKHLAAMQENWVEGAVRYAHANDNKLIDSQTNNPFEAYAPYDNYTYDYKFRELLRFTFKKVPAPISSVEAMSGSTSHSTTFFPAAYQATITSGDVSNTSPEVDTSAHTAPTPVSIRFDGDFSTLMYTDKAQDVTGLKTFKVLPQSEATPADAKDFTTKAYVDAAVQAGGGGGGSATPPANMVTTDTEQTITALKTFGKLPKSTAVPADNAELVNKKYVDDKVAAGGGAAPTNMVTTDTEQTIAGAKSFTVLPKSAADPAANEDLVNKKYVDGLQGNSVTLNTTQTITAEKTFSALPKSTVVPADDAHLVNKKYVDEKVGGGAPENMVTTDTVQDIRETKRFLKLPTAWEGLRPSTKYELVTKDYVDTATATNTGYTLKFYGTLDDVSHKIGFYNLRVFLATGEQLRPRFYPSDKHCGREPHVYTLWTLDPAWTSDKPAETKTEWDIQTYPRTPQDFLCKMRSCGSFGQDGFKVSNPYGFDFDGFLAEGNTLEEKTLLQFEFEGSMPPITKVEFTINSGTNKGKSIRIESFVTGSPNKVEYTLDLTHYTDNQATGIPLNPAFKPEPYYVNRYDEQDVYGVKHFRTLPILEKPIATFGTSNGNNPPAMADFYNSVAIPLPPKQAIIIGSRPDKTNIGDKPPYKYDWTLTVSIGEMTLKRRNPNTLVMEELYLKCQGPTTNNGIMGVLTTQKPDGYPNAIEEKDQAAMDKYQLQEGECWCKLGYYENLQGHNENEDTYLQYEKPGSTKLKELFQAQKQWYNATNREYNWRDDGGPKLMVALYIYNSPLVSWTIKKTVTRDPGDTFKVWGDSGLKAYNSYYLPTANFAADMPDINLKTVNVIAAIDSLEARIKKLEEAAAPQP